MTLLGDSPLPHGQAVERLRSRWPWFAAFGALSVFFGVASLVLVNPATIASVYLIAIFVIIIGGLDISLALHAHRWTSRLLVGAVGLFYIVAGSFALANPEASAVGLTLLLGLSLVATGALRLFLARRLPEAPRWQVGLAGGLTTVLGLLIVFGWPQNSPYVLGLFLGVDMMMYGAGQLAFALFLRRRFSPSV
ncbi:HdeD family acid-resistance protein [Methylocystis bryophila]|uniref:HdeD protein n=1 Tax=Methylocystis bryophila TaxID=655015 RepID=A0A1W6MRN8_9HYPH|nr:DUF308 domain-containing protein [Methylocystis bryophila]ARN80232.1 hypothetical protein B1812_03060 [Methylocystis bryophila]BDV40188.1 hypothetical protein DSM21852_34410 [Methylocystis bryophila]